MLGKRFQQQSNIKLVQLHYFLSKNVGGAKDIMSPLSKRWGNMSPSFPHKLGPCVSAVHNCKNTRLGERLDEPQSIEMYAAGMGTPRVDSLKFVNYTVIENANIVR